MVRGCNMGKRLSLLAVLLMGMAALLSAQTPAPGDLQSSQLPATVERVTRQPTESDVYCTGFFTARKMASSLIVLGGEEGALKNEYGDHDIVYLSGGRSRMNIPGGQYMLVRPIKFSSSTETFTGQQELLRSMGTLYVDIARIEVKVLHEGSATAEILHACEPVVAGDIAIPLDTRPAPPFKTAKFTERFAPSSGKATGTIVALKDDQTVAGTGHIAYINLGNKQGLKVGEYLRIFRTYATQLHDSTLAGTRDYLTDLMGVPQGHQLTREESNSLPRSVLGEMMILSTEEDSAVGIITYSLRDIYPGDPVELE